jgi:hypothetical protein
MNPENDTWKSVTDEMPDADQTVLVHCPDADEPVWLGFHDGECWRDANVVITESSPKKDPQ